MSVTKSGKGHLPGVKCDCEKCHYNTDHYCSADHIQVENTAAKTSGETSCATFISYNSAQ